MKQKSITAILLAKNEEKMIANCINTLKWCDQIIVIDNGSTDQTVDIAEKQGAKIISFKHHSYAVLREFPMKHIENDWLFYVDPDERITPTLAKEIQVKIETGESKVFTLKRKNYLYGQEFKYGGWEKDFVTRLFERKALQGWHGEIHESPVYKGETQILKSSLIHLTHRNTINGLKKTITWTPIEAKLLYESGVSPIKVRTLFRKTIMEFIRRAIIKKGYKDGMKGLVESMVQAMNRFLVYAQVWELQQQPSLDKQYQVIENRLKREWEKQKEIK